MEFRCLSNIINRVVRLLLFGNLFISKSIYKVKRSILGMDDRFIKKIEYIRGLYRYPNKMLGRNFKIDPINNTDVLVFAAHPDDDVLGLCSTLYRHSLKGDKIKVIFVTNGTAGAGESWHRKINQSKNKANLRYQEAVQALSQINISKENIYCLGFPDAGTQRYLKNMSKDVFMLVHKLKPRRVYVHCIEGGHIDHDMTSLVVQSICNKIGYTNVFEWTEYNSSQPIGTQNIKFLPAQSNRLEEMKIDISEEERILKRKMLACHKSQDVEKYFMQGEAIRRANIAKFEIEYLKLNKRLFPIVKEFNKSLSILLFIQYAVTETLLIYII